MIAPLFALLLGGAQGLPPAQETWNASTFVLVPARVLSEGVELTAEGSPDTSQGDLARNPPAKGGAEAFQFPLRLERAVVYPAP